MISKAIWNTVRVGDIAKVISGYAFKSNEFQKRGISVIKIKNIRKGFVDLTDAQHVDKKFLSLNEKYHVKYGDLLISLTGSHLTQPDSVVGRIALQNHSHGQCLLNQRAGKIIITDPLKCNSRYLFYTLSYEDIARSIALMAHGAASQANVSPTQIESLKICLPTLITQRKIASILSAYDDLIENNNRRIKILEEMAQAVYKEWFVHFRFPGHEKVKMVASELGKIPEGWEVKQMNKVADVIDCLHSKKPKPLEMGTKILLQLFNIAEGGKIDLSKKYFISDEDYALWTKRIKASEGDCVITNVGRIAAVAQIPKGLNAALGRNMTAVRANPEFMTPSFLIEYLLSPHMKDEVLKKKDSGTIMDSLNVKGILKLSIILPPFELLKTFENIVKPIRRRIELLFNKNMNLCQTRDLLLPKLINGEVDIDSIEIKLEEENHAQ